MDFSRVQQLGGSFCCCRLVAARPKEPKEPPAAPPAPWTLVEAPAGSIKSFYYWNQERCRWGTGSRWWFGRGSRWYTDSKQKKNNGWVSIANQDHDDHVWRGLKPKHRHASAWAFGRLSFPTGNRRNFVGSPSQRGSDLGAPWNMIWIYLNISEYIWIQ